MLQLIAILTAKVALLVKEGWDHLAAYLVTSKTSGLWNLPEKLLGMTSDSGEEKILPSMRSHSKDKPSTSALGPSVFAPTSTTPQPTPTKITVIFPMNESSLHDSGIKHEYLPM